MILPNGHLPLLNVFRHLLMCPKDKRVVVVESLLCPTDFRECLARVLFRHFEVCLYAMLYGCLFTFKVIMQHCVM